MFDAEKQLTVLSYIFSFTSRIWPTFPVITTKKSVDQVCCYRDDCLKYIIKIILTAFSKV